MRQYPFGKNLKHLRRVLGLTQGQIAKATNANVSSISKYEFGEEATLSIVIQIAKAFGITLDDLVLKDLTVEKITVTFNNVQIKLNQDETTQQVESGIDHGDPSKPWN